MSKTIFSDIDGTLVKHQGTLQEMCLLPMEALPGATEKVEEWHKNNYYVVLTTARPESMRKITEEGLTKLGFTYDLLIMSLPNGPRVVINDLKPYSGWESIDTAVAINLKRDVGLKAINV